VNLIPNGDFEQGEQGWHVHVGAGTIDSAIVAAPGSDHGQAAILHATGKARPPGPEVRIKQRIWGRWYQPKIGVSTGQTYRLRLRVRTSSDFDGKAVVWLVNSAPQGPAHTEVASTACTNGQWKQLTIGPFEAKSASLGLYLNILEGPGKVWYDQVQLVPAD
jgi:hypothetical protein